MSAALLVTGAGAAVAAVAVCRLRAQRRKAGEDLGCRSAARVCIVNDVESQPPVLVADSPSPSDTLGEGSDLHGSAKEVAEAIAPAPAPEAIAPAPAPEVNPGLAPEPKPTPETKPAQAPEAKPALAPEAKTSAQEAKPGLAPEPKPTPETKPAQAPEAKPALAPEAKTSAQEAKPGLAPEPKPTPETKPAQAPEAKPALAPEAKASAQPASAPEAKPAPAPLAKPAPAPAAEADTWLVVGGTESGGIVVREAQGLKSRAETLRLQTGSKIRMLQRNGDRLEYALLQGEGPPKGWVSIRTKDKELLAPAS